MFWDLQHFSSKTWQVETHRFYNDNGLLFLSCHFVLACGLVLSCVLVLSCLVVSSCLVILPCLVFLHCLVPLSCALCSCLVLCGLVFSSCLVLLSCLVVLSCLVLLSCVLVLCFVFLSCVLVLCIPLITRGPAGQNQAGEERAAQPQAGQESKKKVEDWLQKNHPTHSGVKERQMGVKRALFESSHQDRQPGLAGPAVQADQGQQGVQEMETASLSPPPPLAGISLYLLPPSITSYHVLGGCQRVPQLRDVQRDPLLGDAQEVPQIGGVQLLPQPQPGQGVLEVELFTGSVSGVHYLGPRGCKSWNHEELTTTYWLAPDLGRAVMLRSNTECMLSQIYGRILDIMERESGNSLMDPILSFNGLQDHGRDRVSQLSTGDTFLIWNRVVPDGLEHHKGKLWECQHCGHASTAMKNLKRVKCVKGEKNHRVLFEQLPIAKNWGSNLDKNKQPYGCPLNHIGTGQAGSKQPKQPQQPEKPQQTQAQQPR